MTTKLNLQDIEKRVEPLGNRDSYDRKFLFDLLLAFGKPKSSISRLRSGAINVAQDPEHEVAQKNVVYLHEITDDTVEIEPLAVLEDLKANEQVTKYAPRFIMVTDYDELIAYDTKNNDTIVFPLRDLPKHFTFFLPWAGMEKTQYIAEGLADVKAAERMGKLFDEILKSNPELTSTPEGRHAFNVFFTRLLFCFFAEDTGIFEKNQFTNALGSQTYKDGSNTQAFLIDLFDALDTEKPEDKPSYLASFPYVNGHLFSRSADMTVPAFSKHARKTLIELGTLQWQEINPDIFGSMFQAIVSPDQRSDLGQHYTSVPNILKTINPLFMDNLHAEFEVSKDSSKRLKTLLNRISKIKVLDPACGSGNFLIIAYKELRTLEHQILERLAELDGTQGQYVTSSMINIENFFGIEIDDFAVEVAILSLWIAKHQMNLEFESKFGVPIPLIPLKEAGHIVAGNSTRIDWNEVCSNNGEEEIYLIGNPPYMGVSSNMSKEQKADYPHVFAGRPLSKSLDYIALWFIKGADYIQNTKAELAFVSTNSITQGSQVSLLFPMIFEMGIEIGFAYTSFKWTNNAKHNAGVTVVVISLRNENNRPKFLFSNGLRKLVHNINGYLTDGSDIVITRRTNPLNSSLPAMLFGNKAIDAGNLFLTAKEKEDFLATNPQAKPFIRQIYGSSEFIKGTDRYCLWIADEQVNEALEIPAIAQRVDNVKAFRLKSSDPNARKKAEIPWSFREQRGSQKGLPSIIVPSVSSERREYIPIGFLDSNTVISNLAFAVYDAEPWLFALLTSRMHMVWTGAVGGKMKTDYRYSNTIVYNNFPVPKLSEATKEKLTEAAFKILDVREYHCEMTLAELYDPDKMPRNLWEAHRENDLLVDSLYSKHGFESDDARLSTLFDMYEKQINQEKAAGKKK